MLLTRRTPWPACGFIGRRPPVLDGADAVITFIGHATFLIQTAGSILTDPMLAASRSVNLLNRDDPVPIEFDDLPISMVLLSHNHYDHCDVPTIRRLAARFDPIVVTPLGNGRLVRSTGIRRVEELDWWQVSTTSVVPTTLTPARHFSARTPFDRNLALWGGFVLHAGRARIFFAGDTAYGPFFRDIRQRLGPINLALLPIGAYEPRWFMHVVHMNPEEAAQAHVAVMEPGSFGKIVLIP